MVDTVVLVSAMEEKLIVWEDLIVVKERALVAAL